MKINNLFNAGAYAAPSIEIVEFAVEAGFAESAEFSVDGVSELYENDLEL